MNYIIQYYLKIPFFLIVEELVGIQWISQILFQVTTTAQWLCTLRVTSYISCPEQFCVADLCLIISITVYSLKYSDKNNKIYSSCNPFEALDNVNNVLINAISQEEFEDIF